GELWQSVLLTPCSFPPRFFNQVMENLLRNPNVTSSLLFRADILYDSEKDPENDLVDDVLEERGLVKHLKQELKPRPGTTFDGYTKQRAVVRKLVPRNPNLDPELVQTVWNLKKSAGEDEVEEEKNLVVYIPHADDPDSIPFYHPKVQSLAFLHSFTPETQSGTLSLHYRLFGSQNVDMSTQKEEPSSLTESLSKLPLPQRLERIALNLLRTVHKHATGQQAGYKKRVHHDLLVDQATFQDTYTRLKKKYAKGLLETWAEVTDPKKHVFEDLGIAAFLIEIWRGMYGDQNKKGASQNVFPGFVDIGCGNGVLVHILLSEGYEGWGFDVRRRKSWAVFPEFVQDKLKDFVLIPEILRSAVPQDQDRAILDFLETGGTHDGIFPAGTFIISNHADQLTPWTPLLAYVSNCPFIAIPCCSHALNGKLSRFYDTLPEKSDNHKASSNNVPSAYAGFTAHVVKLAAELGYGVESEVLRIPSTRNLSIV
ncbi:DUF1613-domain-containing protein, partial [Microthyrium microscopicum]